MAKICAKSFEYLILSCVLLILFANYAMLATASDAAPGATGAINNTAIATALDSTPQTTSASSSNLSDTSFSITINIVNVRSNQTSASIPNHFVSDYAGWKIVIPNASAAKMNESANSVQWRARLIGKDADTIKISYFDKYNQPHSESYEFIKANENINLSLHRKFNTVFLIQNGTPVAGDIWFAPSGKSDALAMHDKCLAEADLGYSFPVIWQGNSKAYSLYVKIGMDILEIDFAQCFYGEWGAWSIIMNDTEIFVKSISKKPIPGLTNGYSRSEASCRIKIPRLKSTSVVKAEASLPQIKQIGKMPTVKGAKEREKRANPREAKRKRKNNH